MLRRSSTLRSRVLAVRAPLGALRASPFAVALLVGCNAITGVNDLSVPLPEFSSGAGAGTGSGAGAGTSGTGTGPGTGTGAGGGTTGTGNPGTTGVPAQGVTINQIAIYQGPKLLLMGGTETGTVKVPVVAGRDALVRVFVQTDGTYDGSAVTAHLYVGQGSKPIEVVGNVSNSSEGSLSSTINFDVPGAAITAGVTYRVELLQPPANSKGTNAAASYPASGFASLGSASDGASLKVVVVPVQYGGDGSNRLPDTSAAQIQTYKDAFFATYPVDAIDLTVGTPFAWGSTISPDGTGWSELLSAIADHRQQLGAPADVYYFGAFAPADSFASFCGGGCVAGLGMVGAANDTYSRAAIGLDYTDPQAKSNTTIIHEVGHTQGRNHAPCGGAQGVDPGFPYSNGDIGDWGYNLVTKQLLQPGKASDMMGYCDPVWISDYTFNAIFQRMKTVNGAEFYYPQADLDRVWERARVDMQGNLVWLAPQQLHTPPAGQPTQVTVQTAGGASAVTGQYFPYDHIAGGMLLWPQGSATTTGITVSLNGNLKALAH